MSESTDPVKYYRDEDVLVREQATGSPERWSERKQAWVPYADFNWGMSHALTEEAARAMAPEAFES